MNLIDQLFRIMEFYREMVKVEYIYLVRLLDLTAEFGVKTKLTPISKLREKSKTGIQS